MVRADTPANPALYVELPREEKPLPRAAFTREEVECVLAQPDVTTIVGIRDRAVMETLFATGIRRNELVHLELTDLDAARRTLTVRRGKGKRGRMVPISDRALVWINRYLTYRSIPASEADAPYLFLPMRGHMLGSVVLSSTVRKYVDRAAIGKSGSCHMFRATTATLMIEAGVEMRFIQELLGHAKITTTQVYTRISAGALHNVYAQRHPSASEPFAPLALPFVASEKDVSRPYQYRWNAVKSTA